MIKEILISSIAVCMALVGLADYPAGTTKFGKMRDKDYIVTNGWQAVEGDVAVVTNAVMKDVYIAISNATIDAKSGFNNWTNSNDLVAGKDAKLGDIAQSVTTGSVLLGAGSEASTISTLVGTGATAVDNSVAFGSSAKSSIHSASFGNSTYANDYSTSVGPNSSASARSLALGYLAYANNYATALGTKFIGTSVYGATAQNSTMGIIYSPSEVLFDSYSNSREVKSLQAYLDEKAFATNTYTKSEIDTKIDAAGKVKSVNGKEGIVVLDADDVNALPATKSGSEYIVKYDTRYTTRIYIDGLLSLGGSQPIQVNAERLNFLDNQGHVSTLYPDGSKIMTKDASDAVYVAQETGKVLSSNDFTDALKTKLEGLSISPTDATFTNAVLATVMNIDTNYVADINSLVDDKVKLPITGTASIGALLTALAAAVSKLKKSKAEQKDLDDLSATVGEANTLLESVA